MTSGHHHGARPAERIRHLQVPESWCCRNLCCVEGQLSVWHFTLWVLSHASPIAALLDEDRTGPKLNLLLCVLGRGVMKVWYRISRSEKYRFNSTRCSGPRVQLHLLQQELAPVQPFMCEQCSQVSTERLSIKQGGCGVPLSSFTFSSTSASIHFVTIVSPSVMPLK